MQNFWADAFSTAIHVINRLPTHILGQKSPYEVLFKKLPNYLLLKPFGYACYPHLRSFNSHKMDFRSSHCIFIGYSMHHKGYKCFTNNGKIIISINVIFDEDTFPYTLYFSINNIA
uniref:Retrovirus-related Pol polyprotein from transposon TNT 1-94 n=1 Tax=Cajanus cajan TaxID=3821 RepID=A0A151S2Z7_CAJCA|nr:Retrovirus-related Pol polyprotein from transposon TNT 1-94 [Cajanus cajan]